jgi:hypothetical protein
MNKGRMLANLIIIAIIILSIYLVVSGVFDRATTGGLVIKTSDPTATIAISQTNHDSQYLGLQSVKVRLAPGSYLVSAADQQQTAWANVTIQKGQTVSKYLNISQLVSKAKITNKLVEKLPYVGPAMEYTISYYLQFSGGHTSPVFTISYSSPSAKQAAIAWLEYYGYNPINLPLVYVSIPAPPAGANAFE